ncbi:LysR family transcriptional regulator [Nocardiopsis nanhaiensis]
MDTRLLRSFLAVARLGSFTDAASELGYTQSTVTSHVQKLERQLDGCLLDRLPTGVAVTDVGARLVPRAEEVLSAEGRLRAAACGSGRPSGTVRLMAPESLCTYRLPAIISAVRRAEPAVQVWVTPGGIDDALDSVRRGTVDLALSMEPREPPTELTIEPAGTEPLVFLDQGTPRGGAEGGSTGTEGTGTWAQLTRRDALLIEEGCGYSDGVADQLSATGEAPGRRSRFGSVEAIKRCVDVGLGWTVLPRITAESEIRSGTLRVLDGPPLPDCRVHIITHPRRHQSPAVGVVAEQLRRAWRDAST